MKNYFDILKILGSQEHTVKIIGVGRPLESVVSSCRFDDTPPLRAWRLCLKLWNSVSADDNRKQQLSTVSTGNIKIQT